MAKANEWTREQLLIALRLYLDTEFGRLHAKNRDIIDLAARIGRTPSALSMKACNFASLDPELNRKGLSGASQADRAIWAELQTNSTALAIEMEEAASRLGATVHQPEPTFKIPTGPTEKEGLVKIRRVQGVFRAALMISYEGRCAITGIAIPELLVASHIIPWRVSKAHRANPSNGLLLNALFDRAFDAGLMTFDVKLRVMLSKRLQAAAKDATLACSLLEAEGSRLNLPKRFPPLSESLQYHREVVFCRG